MNSRYRYFTDLWLGLRPFQTDTSIYMGAIGHACVLALALVILAGVAYGQTPATGTPAGSSIAVQPALPPSGSPNIVAPQTSAFGQPTIPGEGLPLPVLGIAYWEQQSEKYMAARTKLEEDLKGIQKKIADADPAELRDHIAKAKEFIASESGRRIEASQFVDPDVYDLLLSNARQRLAEAQSEYNDRLHEANRLMAQLNNQAIDKQQTLDMYTRFYYDATQRLADARTQHNIQAKEQQLNLLDEKLNERPPVQTLAPTRAQAFVLAPAPAPSPAPATSKNSTSKKHQKGGL